MVASVPFFGKHLSWPAFPVFYFSFDIGSGVIGNLIFLQEKQILGRFFYFLRLAFGRRSLNHP